MSKYHPTDVRYKGPSTAYVGNKARPATKEAIQDIIALFPHAGQQASRPPVRIPVSPPRPQPSASMRLYRLFADRPHSSKSTWAQQSWTPQVSPRRILSPTTRFLAVWSLTRKFRWWLYAFLIAAFFVPWDKLLMVFF